MLIINITAPADFRQRGIKLSAKAVDVVDLTCQGGYALGGQFLHMKWVGNDLHQNNTVWQIEVSHSIHHAVVFMATCQMERIALVFLPPHPSAPGLDPNKAIRYDFAINQAHDRINILSNAVDFHAFANGYCDTGHRSTIQGLLDGNGLMATRNFSNSFYQVACFLAATGKAKRQDGSLQNQSQNTTAYPVPAKLQGPPVLMWSNPPIEAAKIPEALDPSIADMLADILPQRTQEAIPPKPDHDNRDPAEEIPVLHPDDPAVREALYKIQGDLPVLPQDFRWATEVSGVMFVTANGKRLGAVNQGTPMMFLDALGMRADQLRDPKWAPFLLDQAQKLQGAAMALKALAVSAAVNLTEIKPEKPARKRKSQP